MLRYRRLVIGSGALVLALALALAFFWRSPAPSMPAIPDTAAITPQIFSRFAAHLEGQRPAERDRLLDALQAAIDRDPAQMIDALDQSGGGALKAYTSAMVSADRTDTLGRQAYLVLRGGDPQASPLTTLAVSEIRDGGLWYPLADAAGTFIGEIGAALAQAPEREAGFLTLATALQTEPPHDQGRLYQWLFDAATTHDGTRLQSGALQAFGLSYDKATQDSVLMR